jgi:hypothetical protein
MRRLLLASLILLPSCSGGEDLGAANREIGRFHAELNAGQFDRIFAESAPEWKQASPRADTIKLFTAIHNKMGAYVSGNQNSWRVNYGTGGTIILVLYDSKFQKGDGQETFTYRRSGDDVQLVGYNLNSPTLITG